MRHSARIHRYVFLSLALTCTAAAWVGCAEPDPSGFTSSSSSSSSSSTSSSGEAGSGGAGGSVASSSSSSSSSSSGSGGACVGIEAEGHRVPLDILFLIDRSGSMAGPKWEGTKAALINFFNDQASAGIAAGMVYFPPLKPDLCNPQSYAVLDVPIGTLPANSFALTNSLPSSPLGTNTPTYPALMGVLQAATSYQDTYPTHKVVVVVATDGDPTSCPPLTIDDIAILAQKARNYNGVRTFVIGVQGSTIVNLNKIASAGGTDAAYDVTQDINEFAAKMAEIRLQALACDFELPQPPDGMQLDKDLVNFKYAPKGIGDGKIIPRVDTLADCGNLPGWYYDSVVAPTKILLCPASCATVQADITAKISIQFGCNTIIR